MFTAAKDPLGAGFVSSNSNNCGRGIDSGSQHNAFDHLAESQQSSSSVLGIAPTAGTHNGHYRKSSNVSKPSLSRLILSLDSNASKQVHNNKFFDLIRACFYHLLSILNDLSMYFFLFPESLAASA